MEDLRGMAEIFRRFGDLECPGMSTLYERLSLAISGDPEILAIAVQRRAGQPAPNLFFAAVHALLLEGSPHPLARFYTSLSPATQTTEDPYPVFRTFCLERRAQIVEIISTRAVQTNVIRRSALLLPAFARAMGNGGNRPTALIEIGASAGLNLFWDRYGFDYGGRLRWGDPASPVQLATTCQGPYLPPVPESAVNISQRVGLDLEPVYLDREDGGAWLRALIWPERRDEADLLSRAMDLARSGPPQLFAGDALDLLPGVLDAVPTESRPCIFHSHTLNQFPIEARERFAGLIDRYGGQRDLDLISLEGRRGQENSELDLATYRNGARKWEHLATCDSHGYRIKWLMDS